jgi:hypothetical protein
MLTAKMDGSLNLMPTGPTAVGSFSAKQQAQLPAPALLTTRRTREQKEAGEKQPRSQGAEVYPERRKGTADPSHIGEIAKESKHHADEVQKTEPTSLTCASAAEPLPGGLSKKMAGPHEVDRPQWLWEDGYVL